MPGVYMIAIRWASAPKNKVIEDAIATVGTWLRFSQHCWLLHVQTGDAQTIYAELAKVLSKADNELIVKIDPVDYQGWAPKWINEWINERTRQ
jgi:hypothetical protein